MTDKMIPMMLKKIIPCASLCFLLCCCASADLTIVGGTRGQREAIQWVYADRIPLQFHTSQSIAVQILNDTDMDSFLNDSNGQPVSNDNSDDSVDGVYEDGPPVITLRASRPDDELEYTASHEYGHYVWRTRLNGQQKRAYNRIYAIQKSLGNLISDYAGYSVDEGFAEAFATYANFPAQLKAKDPLSYQFLCTLQRLQSQHGRIQIDLTQQQVKLPSK